MAKIITRKFTSGFTHWIDTLPSGIRFLFQHPITGESYWISREKFLENYSSGSTSGGATAYEIYAATTSDRPILSESDWIASLHGQAGEIPYIGTNGNWWVGTTDTGIRAQSTTVTPTIFISGIKKGMTIEWYDPDNIPTGFVLSDGNYNNNFVPINGIVIPDHRDVMPMGYNPAKPATPTDVSDDTENYGKVGNTGGANSHKLTQDELPPTFFYIFANSNDPGDNTQDSNPLAPPVWSTNHKKGNQDYDIYAKPGAVASIGVTNTIGKGVAIPMRPKYGVFCYITKVSDDDQNMEVGGQFIDPIPGTNILINKTDLAHPVFSVDMTKVESIVNSDAKLLNKVDKNGTDRLITEAEIAEFRGKQNNLGFTPEQAGVAEQLIEALKDGVTSDGDTLKKLYDLIVSRYSEITVANIADRDAYNITKLPTSVFVLDDGDSRWALYKATSTGTNASYIKLSDPDLLNSVMSASQIAAAYESVPDVNRFTNAYKLELETAYGWGNHADAGYLKTEAAFNSWNKSDGISISKSQIRDFPDSLKSTYALTINGAAGYSKVYDGSLPISITYSDVNAAPASTVGFPGFGSTHYLAAYGDHAHAGIYEPVITSGYSNQYWRGDKTWQLMPTSLPASDVYAWAKASTKPSYSWSEIGSKPTTLAGYGITDMGSQSVNYANNAGNATGLSHYPSRTDGAWYNVVWASGSPSPMYSCDAIQILSSTGTLKATTFQGAGTGLTGLANSLSVYGSTYSSYTEYVANDSAYMRFHWSGQGGQPTWLWGSGDASNMYVYNPSNFSVNYANTAGHANDAVTKQDGSRYATDFNSIMTSGFYNAEGNPPNSPGAYGQLIVAKGIDTGLQIYGGYANDNLWFRGWGGSGSTFYSWRKVWHDGNFTPSNYSLTTHTHDYATHRGEGTNYVDYSRYVYNNGAYSGSGWVEPSDLGVRYAASAGSASYLGGYTAAQLIAAGGTAYDGGHNFPSNNGYQKFTNGLKINWGYVDMNNGATATVSFASPFTTYLFYTGCQNATTGGYSANGSTNNTLFNVNLNGMSIFNGSGNIRITWIAFGI